MSGRAKGGQLEGTHEFNLLIIAALVKRLGSPVHISQADIDAVAFQKLHECMLLDGDTGTWAMRLELQERRVNG
jgi:hypothetical protein